MYYEDGTNKVKTSAKFNPYVEGWRFTSMPFTLSDGTSENKVPKSVELKLVYNNQENKVCFDMISLSKDSSKTYSYDKDGNLISSINNGEQKSSLKYDSNDDLIEVRDAKNQLMKYTYDDKHRVTKAESQLGVDVNYAYTGTGQVRVTDVKNTANNASLRTDTAYTQASGGIKAGAYMSAIKDVEGYMTRYSYDLQSGQLKKASDVYGVETAYTYKANTNLLSSVTQGDTKVSYCHRPSQQLRRDWQGKGN